MEEKLGKKRQKPCDLQGETVPSGFMQCDEGDECKRCFDGNWVESSRPVYNE